MKNLIWVKILVPMLVAVCVVTSVFIYVPSYILNNPAANGPDNCIASEFDTSVKTLVTVGDSITHGIVSVNYSKMIENEMSKYGYQTINAGINADLAITALRKIEQVIACKPKVVTVLLGTNDVMGSLSEDRRQGYISIDRVGVQDSISIESYQKNLQEFVDKLVRAGVEKIFLVSLPLLGEDVSESVNQKTKQYSEIIRNIATADGVHYVPLNEAMRMAVKDTKAPQGFPKEKNPDDSMNVVKHYFLGTDLDSLFEERGYKFLTEGIHLNTAGAELTSSLILKAMDEQGLLVND